MRPPEIENEQIINAGQQLQEDGRKVTGFALRKIVGGGNPSRLARVWEDHRRSQEVVASEPAQELPVEVEEALNEMTGIFLEQVRGLAQNLNARAVKTAERRVADVMRSAKEQQENAEAELVDAATTVEDLEDQLGNVRAELSKAQEELVTLRKSASKAERELAVVREKLSKEYEQRESAEESLADIRRRNDELSNDKSVLRKERDEIKTRLAAVETQRDKLIEQVSGQ